MRDVLKFNEFIELLYQFLSRHFNASDFLREFNYPIKNITAPNELINAVMISSIFYIWIIMFSVKKRFSNLYKEILDSFLELIWNRSQQFKDTYKNFENFVLIINADFNKYDNALSDEKDPIFKLCSSFLNYLFNREITDVRALFHISSYFFETSKVYDKIFGNIKLKLEN